MFTTIEHTAQLTGYTVDNDLLAMAQGVLETYIGKVEAEIEDAVDKALLANATAYQAAYMQENYSTVFGQVPITRSTVMGASVALADSSSPYIAGLARMACSKLSWRRSRSVHTGPLTDNPSSLGYVPLESEGWVLTAVSPWQVT